MKKTLLLMLGLVATTASFATNEKPEIPTEATSLVRLVATPNQKLKFFVQPQLTTAQIQLIDSEGHVLYSSTNLNLRSGLSQQFDISALGVGTYQLVLTEQAVTNEPIVITKTFVVQPVPEQNFIVLVA